MAFKCDKPGCDDIFKSSSSLWFHTKRVHENMSGKSLRELALQTTLRGTNENVSQKCLDCERIFSTRLNLKKHRLSHHVPHKCLDCDKIFTQRPSLKKHRELKICLKPKTGTHKCLDCGGLFTKRSSLKRHHILKICLKSEK